MLIGIAIFVLITLIIGGVFVALHVISQKIELFEHGLIAHFQRRTDMIPGLSEISKKYIMRHKEIFSEVLELRKNEFALVGITQDLQNFIQLQEKIHHEINFIFQVCNKHPKINRDTHFLYLRDCIIQQSTVIEKEFKKYKKIIEIYNSLIRYKNLSIIGMIIPYSKKTVL
ncbi:hypothetical protein GW846_01230 [Candidatus Gracilibacteria bacterium]|nr:hypothetical protein [Candidatus Gracilibacteria bacterium]